MDVRVLSLCAAPLVIGAASRDGGQTGPAAAADATPPALHEVVVVTPCRDCSMRVVNSPAAVSVIPASRIATAPDPNLAELLRDIPGIHAARFSARQWETTSRQATTNLTNSQLVLVDGRSLYLDFMGLVLWDFVPVDPLDVEQIEVVRGPASAVWGANALTGVVNVITKPPRKAPGSTLQLTTSRFERDTGSLAGKGPGLGYGFSASMARVLGPKLAVRVSTKYGKSDASARPIGRLPRVPHPLAPDVMVGGGELPADADLPAGFRNRGTTQLHADVRLDQEASFGKLSYSAGIAGSDGIVHTGIGPFAIEPGSYLGYGRVAYTRGRFSAGAFYNVFDAHAPHLLAVDEAGLPVRLDVRTQTGDLSAGYSKPTGDWGILTLGGNARYDVFRLSLAPDAKNRVELGTYLQQEVFLGGDAASQWRLAGGVRLDKLGNINHLIFSPRLSLLFKPGPDHSLRLSLNRAFRAPSVIDNSLDQLTSTPVALPGIDKPFLLATRSAGNLYLHEESLTGLELGYIGTLSRRTTIGINLYRNDTDHNIDFTRLPDTFDPWTAADPPPGWPLAPSVLTLLAQQGIHLPRTATMFRNLGPIRREGVELFAEHRFADGISGYANYSWQPEPKPLADANPYPAVEILLAPRNRVNAGVHWIGPRVMGDLSMSYADPAFWVDVLPHEYDGWSPAYTSFDAMLGLRWAEGRVVTLLRGSNLTNVAIQQHVFGDIFKRSLSAEMRFSF